MSLTRQQRRYLERQEAKAARKAGRSILPVERPPRQFLTKTRVLLAIAASVLGIATSVYAFWPSMDIISQPWETFTDASNARFQFKNIGRTTISDVRFDCLINTPTNRNLRTSGNTSSRPLTGFKSQIIGALAPG